jgi:purine-nucleoside phosphorylase
MQKNYGDRVRRAAASLPSGFKPRIGIVLGSGLSGIVEGLGYREVPFSQIAEFPKPTVTGHKGIACLSDKAIIMAGRFHYYEGHAMDEVVLPIFLMRELGVETIVLTNAAGGVNAAYKPGDLVLIKDHINFMGANPFIGPNPVHGSEAGAQAGTPLGDRFFDMSDVYPKALRDLAKRKAGRELHEGVYMAFTGPSYETPAEVRMARTMGADLVGMSTVPEAIAARYLGMKVLGISCVTNPAAGISSEPLDHAEVVAVGKKVEAELKALVLGLLSEL